MTLPPTIRKAALSDVDAITAIHLKAFEGFFLTFLGSDFLRLLYRSIIHDPAGLGYVACDPLDIRGFVMGSAQPAGFYGRLVRKHWWQFGWAAVPAFLRNMTILPRLLRALAMPAQGLPTPGCGTLMSIAVDPTCQSRGVGKMLVKTFLEEAAHRGCNYVNLTTDANNNAPTNDFYQNLGFTLVRTFRTPEGRAMNEYLFEHIGDTP